MPRKKSTGKPQLKLDGFLGTPEIEDDREEDERINLFSSMFKNYGDIQLGKTDFVKELRAIKTDAELLAFVKHHFKIHIPYEPVCEDHQSPGQAFCDAFFGRSQTALWWASRASFKSFGTGLLTVLDTLRYDHCETTILAGSEEQGRQVYGAAHRHIYESQLDHMFKLRAQRSTSINGSQFTILTASPKSVRGPHPQRLKLDEVDEIPEEIYAAAVNQPMTKHGVPMQMLMTSTMHRVGGMMSEIVDAAPSTGLKVYKWCYKEVTEKCVEPDCRNLQFSELYRGQPCPLLGNCISRLQDVPEEERARIKPGKDYVVLHPYTRDENGDIQPPDLNYYDGSCQGGLRRASGYIPVDAQRAARMRAQKKTWEVENESRRPSQEDMVYDPLFLQRGTITGTEWDYTLPVDRSWAMVDWGFNNPTVMLLAQDMVLPGRKLNSGPYHHVLQKEYYWEQRGLAWRLNEICNILEEHNIRQIYADAENIDALMELRNMLAARKYNCLVRGVPFNRFKDILIDDIRNDMEHGHWFISEENCSQTLRDLYKLHYRKNTEDVAKESDHGPDAMVAGWRRFLRLTEYGTTTGNDLGAVVQVRQLANPGRLGQAGSASFGPPPAAPLALPAGSPVGATKSKHRRSRRNYVG
jgi:hypothetical protein